MYRMDKYFCHGCLSKWRVGDIMETCKGCLAHKHMGWTCTQLIEVYEPMLSICDKVFFPRAERAYISRQARPEHVDVFAARRWLTSSPHLLPHFRTQQREALERFIRNPTDETWNVLDPETQLHTLHIRYT